MKALILSLVVGCWLLVVGAVPVWAHVLKADGSIGAVLHIDPEDDPIAGQPATFFFEFKDKTGKFDPSKCDCTVTIDQNGKQLFSQGLLDNNLSPSLTSPSFTFTFPERAVYTLVVRGRPDNGGPFQSFALTYDIRVARTSGTASPGSIQWGTVAKYGILAAGVLIVAALAGYDWMERKRKFEMRDEK